MGYKKLYDPQTGFMRSLDEKGNFLPAKDFKPNIQTRDYTEGNPWQYLWLAPHDAEGLKELLGGDKIFTARLDSLFNADSDLGSNYTPDIAGMVGQYAHGNEPSHHVAYLYNYVGKPRKTQEMVHRIMTRLYDNTSAGYSGNDDCGEMSAWYVLSAMGFYPVNPADGTYQLGTPLFTRCTLHLENGKELMIVARAANKNYYHVGKVKLNGKLLKGTSLSHSDIMSGGLLEFYMSK